MIVNKKKRNEKKECFSTNRRYDARNYADDIDFRTNPHLKYAINKNRFYF